MNSTSAGEEHQQNNLSSANISTPLAPTENAEFTPRQINADAMSIPKADVHKKMTPRQRQLFSKMLRYSNAIQKADADRTHFYILPVGMEGVVHAK